MADNKFIHKAFPDLRPANDMTSLQAAQLYARAGLRVIMLEPNGKAPHPEVKKGWTQKATTDQDTIEDWFVRNPDANVGVMPTGDFIFLDLDTKEGQRNGVTEFTGLHEHVLGPTARTPSGGVHRVFRRPELAEDDNLSLKNMSPRGGGFDLMVQGRQIVAAPSTVTVNGETVKYRWTQGGEPAPMPKGALRKAHDIADTRSLGENDPADAPDIPSMGAAINHQYDPLTDDRSHGIFDFARHLYQFYGHKSDSDILATVWSISEYRQAAMDRRETEGSAIEWIWKYSVWPAKSFQIVAPESDDYDPRPMRDRVDPEDLPPWEDPDATSKEAPSKAFDNIVPLSRMVIDYGTPPDFVIPHWLPKGVLTTLFGKDGTGKTLMTQRICTALAAGKSIMGSAGGDKVKCLMLLTEDTMPAIIDRQRRICRDLGVPYADVDDTLIIPANLMSEDVKMMAFTRDLVGNPTPFMHALENYIEQHSPDVVVLDPISDIYADEENRREKVSQFLRALNAITHRYNIAMILLGHPAKASESEFSGSGAWSSKSRSRWFMAATADTPRAPVSLLHRKSSYGPRAPDITLLWTENGVLRDISDLEHEEYIGDVEDDIKRRIFAFIRHSFATTMELFSDSQQAGQRYLPRAMELRNMLGPYNQQDIIRTLQVCYGAGELAPKINMDGEEGRPLLRDNARRMRSGIWFPPDRPDLEIDPPEEDPAPTPEPPKQGLPEW